jgi:hypothetical protein
MTTSKRLISPHFDNTRWCSHHSGTVLIEGGKHITSANGKNRRWICAACDEKRRERNSAGDQPAKENPSLIGWQAGRVEQTQE